MHCWMQLDILNTHLYICIVILKILQEYLSTLVNIFAFFLLGIVNSYAQYT